MKMDDQHIDPNEFKLTIPGNPSMLTIIQPAHGDIVNLSRKEDHWLLTSVHLSLLKISIDTSGEKKTYQITPHVIYQEESSPDRQGRSNEETTEETSNQRRSRSNEESTGERSSQRRRRSHEESRPDRQGRSNEETTAETSNQRRRRSNEESTGEKSSQRRRRSNEESSEETCNPAGENGCVMDS